MNDRKKNSEKILGDPALPTDDIPIVKFAIDLCDLVYNCQTDVEGKLKKLGYRDATVLSFKTDLATGIVVEWNHILAVAFKGSTSYKEWVNNLKIRFVRTDIGLIHSGFFESVNPIVEPLYPFLATKIANGLKLITTGHSRGGALALLFAVLIRYQGNSVHAVYQFGAPKVGDRSFVDWCDKNLCGRIFHFINRFDFVTDFPPGSWNEFWRLLFGSPVLLVCELWTIFADKLKAKLNRSVHRIPGND